MSTITTTRPIDEAQLDTELGGIGVASLRIGDEVTITADVDEDVLQAAIDAHIPAPPPPTRIEQLQAQVDELTDLLLGGL